MDRFVIPGRLYLHSVRQLTGELINEIRGASTGQTSKYPIGRIFDILPLNPLDGSAAQQLIDRGDITATATSSAVGRFENLGDWLELEFGDANLGTIAIEFDDKISGDYTLTQDALTLNLSPPMKVALKDLPTDIPLKRDQNLLKVVFRADDVSYAFKATTSPFEESEIVVDLLREPAPAHPAPLSAKGTSALLSGGGGDDDDGTGQIIVACAVLISSCLKKDDPQKPPNPKIPDPIPDQGYDYALFPDCVTKSGSNLIGYFVRDPFHGPPSAAQGKRVLLNFAVPNCIQPYTGQEQPPGKYKIRVSLVETDTHLPMKLALTGALIP